jgi:hypothetical protein
MNMLARVGFFVPKKIPAIKLIPIAMGFVGYVVLCNVSLNINSVGFYQVCALHSNGALRTAVSFTLMCQHSTGLFVCLLACRL